MGDSDLRGCPSSGHEWDSILRPLRTPAAGSKRGDVNKEIFAFFSLCSRRANELSSSDKERIVVSCRRSPDKRIAALKSWAEIEPATQQFTEKILPTLE
jgi:hypothetical protein